MTGLHVLCVLGDAESDAVVPALGSEGELGRLGFAEDVHMVVGHSLLRYQHLLAAIDDKIATLHALPVISMHTRTCACLPLAHVD